MTVLDWQGSDGGSGRVTNVRRGRKERETRRFPFDLHAVEFLVAGFGSETRMETTATTAIARWTRCNTQTMLPLLASSFTRTHAGIAIGRFTVQIRSFRLPATHATSTKGSSTGRLGAAVEKQRDDGRNLYVVRSTNTPQEGYVFVEDPAAPSIVTATNHEAQPTHTRWTTSTLAHPDSSLFPFDVLLQRILCTPPNQAAPALGAWIPRTSQILIEGYSFAISHDWIVRVGSVQIKGGGNASGGFGLVIQVNLSFIATSQPDFSLLVFRRRIYPSQLSQPTRHLSRTSYCRYCQPQQSRQGRSPGCRSTKRRFSRPVCGTKLRRMMRMERRRFGRRSTRR